MQIQTALRFYLTPNSMAKISFFLKGQQIMVDVEKRKYLSTAGGSET